MNDRAIRPLLRALLQGEYILEEMITGSTRVDLVTIDPEETIFTGYEIKGSTDSLRLLPEQIRQYEQICSVNYLVTCENHLAKAETILPDYWGIYVVRQIEGEKSTITLHRDFDVNCNLNKTALLNLLWGDELRKILREKEFKKFHRWSVSQMRNTIAREETDFSAARLVIPIIKARGDWLSKGRDARAEFKKKRRLREWRFDRYNRRIRDDEPPEDWECPSDRQEREERNAANERSRKLRKATTIIAKRTLT